MGLCSAAGANALLDNGGGPAANYSGAVFYKVDGGTTFGAKTDKAVRTLQKKYKLPQTGIVSVRTWGELFG